MLSVHEIIWGIGNVLSKDPVALLHMAIYGNAHTLWGKLSTAYVEKNKTKQNQNSSYHIEDLFLYSS